MEEELARLVRERSDSTHENFGTMAYTEDRLSGTDSGGGEPNNGIHMATSPQDHDTESGELLDYNDSSVLEQFHDDALRQAGCGLAQVRVMVPVCLAILGSSLELAAIPFILPSAEIELCILPHEKNWLVLISLVGCSLGSLGWGSLAERLGRRRALVSCLAVNSVFAAIAAFMPTYGTFMMARFCSAIGSGGIIPTSYMYICEMWWRGLRRIALLSSTVAATAGLAVAATLAATVLPDDGPTTQHENKQHFSAWHRYLLLCTLPILAALVSLIWTQESPRYLLEVGREVDAIMLYQNIHRSNQSLVCGSRGGGRAGDLALPGKRRPPAHHVRHSVKMFWQSFFQLFSSPYKSTTLALGGTLLFMMAIQFYLSSFIPATIRQMEIAEFEAAKKTIANITYTNEHFNETIENLDSTNVTYSDSVFRDLLMSHVKFTNCTFNNVSLANVRTSYVSFVNSLFVNTTIIDTDIEPGRELMNCTFIHTTIRGMRGGCARADLTFSLQQPITEQYWLSVAGLISAVLLLVPLVRLTGGICAIGVLLSPLLYVCTSETALYVVQALYRICINMVFYLVGLHFMDHYPHHLRCTGHGIILSVSYMCACITRGAGFGSPALSAILCGLMSVAATVAATYIR